MNKSAQQGVYKSESTEMCQTKITKPNTEKLKKKNQRNKETLKEKV